MPDPEAICADYTLRPSEFAATLALFVEARRSCIVRGPPGADKSVIARQVVAEAGHDYVGIRTLLDPVRPSPTSDSGLQGLRSAILNPNAG